MEGTELRDALEVPHAMVVVEWSRYGHDQRESASPRSQTFHAIDQGLHDHLGASGAVQFESTSLQDLVAGAVHDGGGDVATAHLENGTHQAVARSVNRRSGPVMERGKSVPRTKAVSVAHSSIPSAGLIV